MLRERRLLVFVGSSSKLVGSCALGLVLLFIRQLHVFSGHWWRARRVVVFGDGINLPGSVSLSIMHHYGCPMQCLPES